VGKNITIIILICVCIVLLCILGVCQGSGADRARELKDALNKSEALIAERERAIKNLESTVSEFSKDLGELTRENQRLRESSILIDGSIETGADHLSKAFKTIERLAQASEEIAN
jgi:hypothetical protein